MSVMIVLVGPIDQAVLDQLSQLVEPLGFTVALTRMVDPEAETASGQLDFLTRRITECIDLEDGDSRILAEGHLGTLHDLVRRNAIEVWRLTGRNSAQRHMRQFSTLFTRICAMMVGHGLRFHDCNPKDFQLTTESWVGSHSLVGRAAIALVRHGITSAHLLKGLTRSEIEQLGGLGAAKGDVIRVWSHL